MSRVALVLASVLVLYSCTSISAAFSPSNYNVNCEMYNWWVYVPLPRSLVSTWIPTDVSFGVHPFTTLSNDQWPVLLEFNMPTNCFVKAAPFIKQSMLEWKLEVPYLSKAGYAAPLMFKPVTYENNWINSVASYVQYGINAIFEDGMNMNNQTNPGFYNIDVNGVKMTATFVPVVGQDQYVPIASTDYGQKYIQLNDATEWLGHDVWGNQRCAKIYYQWPQTTVRPVTATIHFDAGFLPNSQQAYDVTSINGAKAIQIRSVEHITNLDTCTAAAKANGVNADAVGAPDATTATTSSTNSNLSTGTVIAIAVGSSVVTTLLLAAIVAVIHRRVSNKHQHTVSHIQQQVEPVQQV